MPISGTFTADFSSFQTAVQNAEVRLKAFEGSSNKVETALSRMTNAFTGQRVVTEATLMSEAIDRIGGMSRLTESELARVSATAKEAAAKLTAMGQDVPPGIQKLASSVNDAGKASTGFLGSLNGVNAALGAFGLAMSVTGVVRFVGSVFSAASQIHDMSLKLGISTDAIQGFKHAAEQGGSSIDAVGVAITKMNDHLAEGKKSTVQALRDAGLEFDNIRRMKPEEAFLAITDAIAGIEDPMERSRLAVELFGRSGAELLPAIQENFRQTANSADKMSQDTIDSLEKAEDSWERLYNKVTIVTGSLIGKMFELAESTRSSMESFGSHSSLWDQFTKNLGILTQQTTGLGDAMMFMSDVVLPKVPPKVLAVGAALKPVAITGAEVDATIKKMNETMGYSATALGLVEPKVGSLEKAIKGFKASTEAMNLGLRFTSEVIGELPPKMEAVAASIQKVAAAQAEVSKNAPGSVGINTGGISFKGNFDAIFKQYSQRYNQSTIGAIGGGPAEDFISWAIRNGYATKTVDPSAGASMFNGSSASGPSANVNVNGILMGSDPAALQQLRDLVSDAVRQSLGGARV